MNSIVTPPYVEPIRKSLRVKATPARAFEVFTVGMDRWWLRTHSINPTKAAIEQVIMEPRAGGRWYERGADGSECDWGRVLAWEPPGRVLLAWQIDARFQYDPSFSTEVEIRFEAQAGGMTEVTLEHRQLERYADVAIGLQAGLGQGWGILLDEFVKALA
ncbi:MAG TPA: SRPBCC family protein [Telluria sp.]|nr:SRPBCC family protein [Telluria sp.]